MDANTQEPGLMENVVRVFCGIKVESERESV